MNSQPDLPVLLSNAYTFYRFAAYYTPAPDSALWKAGNRWLGLDPVSGQALVPSIQGYPPEVASANVAIRVPDLMATPRRYGWHATLKAPFTLAPGITMGALHETMLALCASHSAFVLPALKVQRIGNFLALLPAQALPEIQTVADACVMGLHPLAQALQHSELQRRRCRGLTVEEENMLQQWGYPHVLKQFQFHMSLTGPLTEVSDEAIQLLIEQAQASFEGLPPSRFDSLTLVGEPVAGAAFSLIHRYALSA